jgi:hypothetical protein
LREYLGETFAPIEHGHDDYANTAHDHNDDYYQISEVDALLAGKADDPHNHEADYAAIGHDHDDRYYTEGEVDSLLDGKADDPPVNDGRYYTEGEVDTLLSGKSDVGHTHPFIPGKVHSIVHHTLGSSYQFNPPEDGTFRVIPNFGLNLNIASGLAVLFISVGWYQSNNAKTTNLLGRIVVGTTIDDYVRQDYHQAAGRHTGQWDIVYPVVVSPGYHFVTVKIAAYSGDFLINDGDQRRCRIVAVVYEN